MATTKKTLTYSNILHDLANAGEDFDRIYDMFYNMQQLGYITLKSWYVISSIVARWYYDKENGFVKDENGKIMAFAY